LIFAKAFRIAPSSSPLAFDDRPAGAGTASAPVSLGSSDVFTFVEVEMDNSDV
jgi:hypothetical protein